MIQKLPTSSGPTHRGLLFVAALLAGSALPALAQRAPTHCPELTVIVHSSDPADAARFCAAAARAIHFLSAQGLDTQTPVDVHILPSLQGLCPASTFGCYDCRTQRINMLATAQCLKLGNWAGAPIDPAVCENHMVHETTHAVTARNFSIPRQSLLAHEYLGYVTMLSTMAPDRRARLLARYPGRGFESADEISLTFYLLDPVRFGVNAYRHFLKPGNGSAFIQKVLSGEALARDAP